MSELAPYDHTAVGRKVLISLVPVICPPQYVHLANEIVDHLALTLGASPPLLRKGFDAGLLTYDIGALLSHRRRAHKLSGERAERYYASWEHGPTPLHTQFARALNQLMSMSCYEQPEVMDAVGYHVGPWIEEVKQKRLTVFKDDSAKQAAQILAPDPLRPSFRIDRIKRPNVRKAGA
ncbi:MAG: hypothetical protein H0T46_28065 [Deltaproteobacteria bacterium]|nr:hypothetical protein [Deltaproteobacteria bacterium]